MDPSSLALNESGAVHPSHENDVREFYLMCDDIDAFVEGMKTHNIASALMALPPGLLQRRDALAHRAD